MHLIEPYYAWIKYYNSSLDERSPYHGKEYKYDQYSEEIYGYYIDQEWDFMGSETLYIKILFADYEKGFAVIEFIGEWNDAINNDIMHLKRNIIDYLTLQGINKYILIGENVMNFHGSDDCYYEEWFEDMEEGWIVAINFPKFVTDEWNVYNVDNFLIYSGDLEIANWRTLKPAALLERVTGILQRRIPMF